MAENEKREKRKILTQLLRNYPSNADAHSLPLYPETSDFSSTHPKTPIGSTPVQPSFGYSASVYSNNLYRRHLQPLLWKHTMIDRSLNVKSGKEIENPEDILTYQSNSCRVLMYDNGSVIRKRCDKIMETQRIDYDEAITLFPPDNQSHRKRYYG